MKCQSTSLFGLVNMKIMHSIVIDPSDLYLFTDDQSKQPSKIVNTVIAIHLFIHYSPLPPYILEAPVPNKQCTIDTFIV